MTARENEGVEETKRCEMENVEETKRYQMQNAKEMAHQTYVTACEDAKHLYSFILTLFPSCILATGFISWLNSSRPPRPSRRSIFDIQFGS